MIRRAARPKSFYNPVRIQKTGRTIMKAFLAACVALTVIAVCAAVVLDRVNKPVDEAFATTGARI